MLIPSQQWMRRIIAAMLFTMLSGCGAIRLAYNSAPELLHFYLDGQFSFTDAQSDIVKAELRNLHTWHRNSELPELIKLLQKTQRLSEQTPGQGAICGLFDEFQPRVDALLARALPTMAQVAMQSTPEQWADWQKAFEKRNAKFRADYVSASAEARLAKRLESGIASFERFYGKLSDIQVAALRASLERSAWDGAVALREAQRRQQDGMLTTRQLVADKASPEEAQRRLTAFLTRSTNSPDTVYRNNSARWRQESCERTVAMHNSATPDQRAKALATLRGYEEDLRSLTKR